MIVYQLSNNIIMNSIHFMILLVTFACAGASERSCEPIRIEICRDIGYNVTGMPNLIGQELQQDAQLQLQTFQPLIQYGCSSRLQFFLCSVYVPMCTEKVPDPIGPCRSLCEDIRDKCQPVLQEFGFPWPVGLNCSKFPPQNNNKHMCMEGPADSSTDQNMRMRSRNRRPNVIRNDVTFSDRKLPFNKMFGQHYGLCKHYRFSDQYYYINITKRCAPSCSANIKFTHENKLFADYWVAAWSILCFACTLFSLFIIFLGEYSSRYPETAIVFISFCFNICALAYIIRFLAGRYEASCYMDSQHGVAILMQDGLDKNANCIAVFVLLYFFKLATDAWWVILCITWYLSYCLKWRSETLLKYRNHFHILAWGIPTVMTITAIVTRVFDADELVGICYVGNQNTQNLLYYVLIPNAVHLFISVLFLFLAALPKKCRNEEYSHVHVNPSPLPHHPRSDDNMSSYVGIFANLYVIPAVCVFASDMYEYLNREDWISASSQASPIVEIFSLKFFMLLIMGAAASFVIFTTSARKRAFKKLCKGFTRRKEPVPSYLRVQPQVMQMSIRTKSSLSKTNSETVI